MDELTPRLRGGPRRACDNCRLRKIRCNRDQPCDKWRPEASSIYNQDPQLVNDMFPDILQSSLAPQGDSPYPADYDASLSLYEEPAANLAPLPRRISSSQLQAYVQAFLQHLYSIMPVVDVNSLLLDCASPEALHPRRYALLAALSAATYFQLKNHIPQKDANLDTTGLGYRLAKEAEETLHQFDPLEEPHVDTLLTMFFLFAAYGNLHKPDRAWHFLNQSISFAYTLRLNIESTYWVLNQNEADILRRVYWLLFVTERAYALQTGRPVMLRATIEKPSVFRSESPITMYGFNSLISLFEKITPDVYEWNIGNTGRPCNLSSLSDIYQSVAFTAPLLGEVSETSRVDIILTQQWLQTRLWRFCMGRQHLHHTHSDTRLPRQTPAMAGKIVMSCLSSVTQKSADAHGIGLEQKLYDIGECIFHLSQQLSLKTDKSLEVSTVDAKEVLYGILTSLSRVRGSQSYLFPALLQQSQGLLGLEDVPPPLIETSPTPEADEHGLS
ncbi:conserved hypothetical protein [Talaromyces stipitatus ATCC 10500]|uniref:Xylanolytic transcriptional activator regulatory domain-containing protein n=1 Tax=Talaromyces stipitatus (strain ATCC 10500 / CBS 375.48 / QM 6759 / NRRL 1006) TaxID=441959 RepID=B8MAJ7_TALSN|nr:uncharacterized protein TSTA_112540 [Talaromyces stipitatus ATCC 10500]EED17421.1 conserved hypothetical protein [Talaromyces stipitatus ATCC 10500]